MNPHRHPAKPKAPSRFRFAALESVQRVLYQDHVDSTHAWKYPLNMLSSELPQNQTPALLNNSSPLNQEPTERVSSLLRGSAYELDVCHRRRTLLEIL